MRNIDLGERQFNNAEIIAMMIVCFLIALLIGLGLRKPPETITIEKPIEKIVERQVTVKDPSCEKSEHNLSLCAQGMIAAGEIIEYCPQAIRAVVDNDNQAIVRITDEISQRADKIKVLKDEMK